VRTWIYITVLREYEGSARIDDVARAQRSLIRLRCLLCGTALHECGQVER